MGDLARQSLFNEKYLIRYIRINAELLIDHAWGYESCTIEHIKNYKPVSKSASIGQVLQNHIHMIMVLLLPKKCVIH